MEQPVWCEPISVRLRQPAFAARPVARRALALKGEASASPDTAGPLALAIHNQRVAVCHACRAGNVGKGKEASNATMAAVGMTAAIEAMARGRRMASHYRPAPAIKAPREAGPP